MRYRLTPMFHRPYLLNDLSQKLIESHYENNYGGALREAGFDAKYMKGGHSAWKAIAGPTKIHV